MNMYQTIQKYKSQGLNITEIKKRSDLSRNTVRKYFRMSESEYLKYLSKLANRSKAFSPFYDKISELFQLNRNINVAISSIYDVLEEQHGPLPGSERTLRNYIRYLEGTGELAIGKPLRFYTPVAELPFGKQLQIDFGQTLIANGKRIYIYAAILSASRYRYVAVQDTPFKTLDVIKHTLACFQFIGGRPEELVIDQDRLMVVSENEGDIRYTEGFKRFIQEQELAMRVCRRADPESKGKVENLVKFVKVNFFSARTFESLTSIERKLPLWLARRANGKLCQATKKTPASLLASEQQAFRPLRASLFQKDSILERDSRIVDEKSLISVSGNKYSVPLGYRSRKVEIYCTQEELFIYDCHSKEEIATHRLSPLSGQTLISKAHQYPRKHSQKELLVALRTAFPLPAWQEFVDKNYNRYQRYFREQHAALSRFLSEQPEAELLNKALSYCLEVELLSAGNLKDTYTHFCAVQHEQQPNLLEQLKPGLKSIREKNLKLTVEKRPLAFYSSLVSIIGGLL